MSDTSQHLAVLANKRSIEYAMSKNKDAWLALYRDDATLHDPVGVSPLDPTGLGHNGKAAIEKFWDTVIGPSNITLTAGARCPSGQYSCAVPMRAENNLGGGITTTVDMIAVYEVDENGLIRSMRAYWDWNVMQEQLEKLGFA